MSLEYSEPFQKGWSAPDFSLPATDGNTYQLSDFLDAKGFLLVFTCNHCPYAQASWPPLIALYPEFKDDVRFAAINPNDAEAYPEDSFDAMKRHVEDWLVPFPYVYDESQQIARAYGAQCTPDVYLFKTEDGAANLFYRGRINDNWKEPADVQEENLKDALRLLADGAEPPMAQHPSMGCSIKWKE